MSKSRSGSKTTPPKRPAHAWRRRHFSLPPELNAGLEVMAKSYGEGVGAFLRYLIRQEWKTFGQKQAPSAAP